jgi:putative nucleotidyltransferase with HDIG domain
MKQKIEFLNFLASIEKIKKAIPPSLFSGPVLAAVAAFVFSLIVVLANMRSGASDDLEEFEVGKVADRDVVAEQALTYEDEEATRVRLETQERQVPAVFHYSLTASEEIRTNWNHFSGLAGYSDEELSREEYLKNIQEAFPGFFPRAFLDELYRKSDREEAVSQAGLVLDWLLERGIYSLPQTVLDKFNQDVVELIRQSTSRIERERIPFSAVLTREKVRETVERQFISGSFTGIYDPLVINLIEPFVSENVIYSPEETVQRLMETRSNAEPVIKYIERGKKVIKKGFIISAEDMMELQALAKSLPGNDARNIAAQILLLLLLFSLVFFYCVQGVMGRKLNNAEAYLVSVLSAVYISGTVLLRNLSFGSDSISLSLIIPTALVVMLPSILIGQRMALLLALVLPLGAFFTGAFDTPSLVFALVSGASAAFALSGAEKRMDLIRAGLIIAAANCAAMTAVLLGQRAGVGTYPAVLFWAAFNGIVSSMLVLGFLSPLEHALNAATVFRLIELSDLNAPILRRLFTAAPGTYSHSIMVANLAEAACHDIGANALLSRVGAYYHDVGKMENPDYFVENQTDHNRHDDIAPRLSATVIRSHVKLGLEKGRQLGLPREVLDIIGEHHGNSVISWFYNKAQKLEGQVNTEDFSYPGTPPQSRESAVVMLADTTEAAVRTLDKPTVARLDKFIQELFNTKVEHGQLSRAELTFKELDIIKNAFIRVLVGYYHSRIEYPKQTKDGVSGGEAEK